MAASKKKKDPAVEEAPETEVTSSAESDPAVEEAPETEVTSSAEDGPRTRKGARGRERFPG